MNCEFSLSTANTIANLTLGNISSCFDDITSSSERLSEFRCFLNMFETSLISSICDARKDSVKLTSNKLKQTLAFHVAKDIAMKSNDDDCEKTSISYLVDFSHIINNFRIKSLLLPKSLKNTSDTEDSFMTCSKTLQKLIHGFPNEHCLIIQPTKRLEKNSLVVYDAFPYLDVALRHIDMWSAVLFWDNNSNFVFVPIESECELYEVYTLACKTSDNSFEKLKEWIKSRNNWMFSHYYFHLSDFHLEAQSIPLAEHILRTLINKQIECISNENNDFTLDFVMTGDAVQVPSIQDVSVFSNFSEYMSEYISNKSYRLAVPGNHDANFTRVILEHQDYLFKSWCEDFPKIVINEHAKLVFLLFNSNTNNNFKDGEIGTQQLIAMDNKLSSINGIEGYKMVAILHHNIKAIPNPSQQESKWHKKLIPLDVRNVVYKLRDSKVFIEWLYEKKVKLILHGHRHVPFIDESDGIMIIACGSSTGKVTGIEPIDTYLSYNLLKFTEHSVVCTMYAHGLFDDKTIDIYACMFDL